MVSIKLLEIIPNVEIPIITETLSRIGIANKKDQILYPSCYLYKDIDNKYYICHFKELYLIRMDRAGYSNISDDDILRKNSIALLLEKWNLIKNITAIDNKDTVFVFALPYKEKSKWTITHKIDPPI